MGKAKEYRKRQQAREVPTAQVALPSGEIWTLRRPPLKVWAAAGKLPEFLLRDAPALAEMGDEGAAAPTTTAEDIEALRFMREVILYSVVDPKLKMDAGPDDDELDPAEIDEADLVFLFDYIIKRGCPDIPVETREGTVTVASLSNFRQKQPGGSPIWNRPDVGDEQGPAIEALGNTG